MPRNALVALGLASCAFAAAGCGTQSARARVAEGRNVYLTYCSRCHQPDGSGYAQDYPPLAHNPLVTLRDPAPALEMVARGGGDMPGFADELSPAQVAAVVSYIRAAWGNHASAVSPKQAR
jgi:mono/diheme cytochrome c family protein